MKLTWPQRRYLYRYFGEFDDRALAAALAIDRKVVSDYRRKIGIGPTLRNNTNEAATPPAYTGQAPLQRSTNPLRRNDWLVAAFAAVVAFAVYFATLPPTVTGEDSGELVTAAYALGIPHPPGYPAWCLLAHPFIYLPFGTVAWRIALSSAVFGAGAGFFVALITIKLCGNQIAAAAASLLFAFSKDAWEQFVIAEVYALNALFIAACVFLLLEWYESRKNKTLLLFAFLYGLSLADHSTVRLLGPPFLLFVLVIDPVPWKRWKLYAACLGVSFLGLSAYLYLPLRSVSNPPVDWGNPETWRNFWGVVRQEQFSFLLTQHQRSFGLFFQQMKMFLDYYVDAFTPILAALPLLGIYPLWKRNKFLFGFLGGLALLLSVVLVLVLNYGTDRIALVVNNVFFIPFYMVAAIFAGVGIGWLYRIRFRDIPLWPAALGLAGICAIVPAILNYRGNDKSSYYFAYDYGKNLLDTLEPDAIYLPSADHATFPVIYLQAVKGLRPDVTIGNKYGYIEEELFKDMPGDIRKTFRRIPTEPEQRMIEEWIVTHSSRPVYITEKRSFPSTLGVRVENAGLAYRIVRQGETWKQKEFWAEYSWHSLDPATTNGEFTAELVLSDYHFARGRDYLAKGDLPQAKAEFQECVSTTKNSPEAFNNIGTAFAENGHMQEASEYYFKGIEINPNYVTGLRNLGQVYMALQKNSAALLVLDRLRKLDANDMQAKFNYVTCLKALRRFEEARDELHVMAKAQPNDPKIHRELGLLYLQDLHDTAHGREQLIQSLRLDANQPELQRMLSDPSTAMSTIPGLLNMDELVNPLPRLPNLPPR